MQTTVRVLKVFLASPDDVRPERMAAEELVNNLNKFIGHFGWHIALYKWEDAIPGYGRPQEIINAAVDDCALFIGLLWERWGQPTGKYSSGFHEEYERALARRKTTNDPEIWLVFKAASPEKMKDPGTELTKVLEFRRTQSSLREVLYKEVLDSDDWKTKLQNWLWSHVVARAIPVSPSTQRQQPSSTPEPESADASIDHIEVSQQLLGISNIVTEAIKTGQMEFSLQEAKHLKEFDVARLYLLAATWMSRRYTGNTLGTHEMNVLYKYREKLEVTLTEYAQLFRAVLTDAAGVIPGWFWFDAMTSEAIRDQLLALVTRDLSDDVRIAALKLLRDAGINLPEDLRHELPLWDDAEAVRAEAYKYLVSLGDEGALSLVENNITAESADDS